MKTPTNVENRARTRLMQALPHIHFAMCLAKTQQPQANICLSVTAMGPDGSGQVTASFEGELFLLDVARMLGFESLPALAAASASAEDVEHEEE